MKRKVLSGIRWTYPAQQSGNSKTRIRKEADYNSRIWGSNGFIKLEGEQTSLKTQNAGGGEQLWYGMETSSLTWAEETNNHRVFSTSISAQAIMHTWFKKDSIVQEYIQYAYDIGWLDLVLLIECENWSRKLDKKSQVPWEESYGLCQINKYFHPKIVNDVRFFTDYKRQIDQCYKLMKWWTAFYGRERTNKNTDRKKCSDFVKGRFIFEN